MKMRIPACLRCLAAALPLVLLAAGCATNPVTKKSEISFISEQQEIRLGKQEYLHTQQSAGGRFILDPALAAYVNEVGQKLVKVSDRPNLPFEFVVINDSVPNAWALPGGKLAINRGLLTELKSEAELAAVLSHEVVHAAARHGAKSVEQGTLLAAGAALIGALASDRKNAGLVDFAAQGGAALIGLRFSRENELEADHYGIDYMVRAGYDPKAAVELQETFVRLSGNKSSNWLAGMFATHPPSQERVDANRRKAAALPANLYRGEEAYRQKIAFLVQSKPAYAAHDEGRKLLAKDPAQALAKADQAIKLEPREAIFHALRGDALKKQGRVADAEQEYSEAIRLNADYFAHYLNRGLVRRQLGNSAGARADLEQANKLLPTAAGHYLLGHLDQEAGQRGRAIEHYKLAAGSNSEVGRLAGTALVRLDLPGNPGDYVEVEAVADGRGNLDLRVTNASPVALRKLRVAGAVQKSPSSNYFYKEYAVPGTLQPGQSATVAMGVRLADFNAQLKQVRAQVRGAEAAE